MKNQLAVSRSHSRKVLFIGINSGISNGLCSYFMRDGWEVLGTFRSKPGYDAKIQLMQLDIADDIDFNAKLDDLLNHVSNWDAMIMSAGSMMPIGKFFELQFEDVKNAIFLNLVGPMQILHKLWSKRNLKSRCNVFFFSGSGTNGAFDNYLTYTLSKVAGIKLVELLSSEYQDTGFFSIGPGFVKTNIHQETIIAGVNAGNNLSKVKTLLETDGTSIHKIYNVINWCINNSKLASGRNFSVRDDFEPFPGQDATLLKILASDHESFKLRRNLNNWRRESD
jgi:NAD(P)-dependent dehydrogenase (short-subunit alcohol dehydrogenase family)